jgi:hypothetical protein
MFGHPAQTRAHVFQAAEQAGYHKHSHSLSLSTRPHFATSPRNSRARSASNNFIGEYFRQEYGFSTEAPENAILVETEDDHPDINHSGHDLEIGSPKPTLALMKTHTHEDGTRHEVDIEADADSSTVASHSNHDHVHITSSGHKHGHSHGNMNMHALLLHVLGDALGNIGVIASGLIIWLTTWPGKYYSDPIISLVITVIIFSGALPLGKSYQQIIVSEGIT